MVSRYGAANIVAIEANAHHFLKCLVVKELLSMERAKFLYGNFVEYLRANRGKFDVCLALGVLYHMRNPVELLHLACQAAKQVWLWTHYYDATIISKHPSIAQRFGAGQSSEPAGFRHTLYRHSYATDVFKKTFSGGNANYSHWLSRDDILGALRHFGMRVVSTSHELPEHSNGPCFALVAQRA